MICGADVHQIDSSGCTPLFYATALGHADCVRLLLESGADVDHQDNKGRTAAHCGASKGQLETLKILHQHGANLWLKNVRGDLPLHEAVKSGRKDLVKWLLQMNEKSINEVNLYGRSALHIAAFNNNLEMCRLLLEHGADLNSVMKVRSHYLTPLDAAFQNASDEVANFLQSNGAHPIAQINQHLDQYLQRAGLESDTPSPSASDTINETARRHLDKFVGFDDEQTANSKAREVAARVSSASVDNQQDNRKSKRAFSPLTGIPSKQSYVGIETGAAAGGTTGVDTEFTKLPNLVRNSVSRNGHREQTDDSTMPESRHRASSQQQQRAESSTSSIVESANGNRQQNGHDRLHNVREFETDLGSVQPGGGKQPVGTHLKQAIITNVYLTTSPQPVYYVKRVPLPLKKSTKKKRRISGTAASSAASKTSRQTDLGTATCRHTCHKTEASRVGQSTEEQDGAAGGEESSEEFEDATIVNGAKSGGAVCVVLDAHDTVLSERETTDTRVYISQSLTSKKQTVPNEDKDSSSTEQEAQSTKGEAKEEEEEEKEGEDTNVEDQDASTEITSRNNSASLMSSIKSGLIESKESVVTSVDSGINTVKQRLFGEKDTSETEHEVAKDGDNDDEEDEEEAPVPAEDDQSDSGQISLRKNFVDNVQDENETSTADHQPVPDNEELINEDDEQDVRRKRSTEDNDDDHDDDRSTLSHLTDKADGESIQSAETELVTKAEKTVKESDEALETSDLSKIDEVSADDDDEDEMEKTVDEAANDEVDEDDDKEDEEKEIDDKEVDNEKVGGEEEKEEKKVEEVEEEAVKEKVDDDKEIVKETEIENVEEAVEDEKNQEAVDEEVEAVEDEESGSYLKRVDSGDEEHKEENKVEEKEGEEELSDEEDKQTIKDEEEEEDDDAERKKRSTVEQVIPEKVTEEETLQEEEEQSETRELPESRKSDNDEEDDQESSFLDKAKQKVATGIDSLKRRLRLGDDDSDLEDEKVPNANDDKETKEEPEDETEEESAEVDKPVVARRASVDLVKMGPSQLEEMTQRPDSGKEKLENIEESGATGASETDNIDSDGSESSGQNRRKSSVILVKREEKEQEEEPKPVEIESPAKEIQSELDIIDKIQSDQLRLAEKLKALDKQSDKVEIDDKPDDAEETDNLKSDRQKSDNENPTEDQDKQDEQVEEEPEEDEPDDDQFGYESDRSYVKCSRTEPAQTATTSSDQVPLLTRKTSRKYAHVRPKVDSYWSYQRPPQGMSKHRLGAGASTRSLNRASSNKSLHFAHEDYEQIDPTVINQTVEKYLRKYYLERKLFEELYDLKRFQIRTGKSNEPQLVKRLVEKFRKDVKAPGMTDFQGPYSYRAYEMYIYDLLRRLSRSNEKKIAFLTKSISYEDLNASFDKTHSSSDELTREDRYRFWDRDSSSPSPPEHGASRRARHHGTTSAASNGDPSLSYRKSPSGLSVDYKYEYHKSQHYDQSGDNLVDVVRENLYKRTGLGGKKMDEVVISRKLVEKIVDDAAGSDSTFADGATDQPHSDNKPDPTQASDSKTSTKNTEPSSRKAKSNKTTSSKVFDSKQQTAAADAEAETAAASTAQRKVGSMNAGKATRKRATKPKIDRPLIIAPVPSCSKAALNRPKFKRTKMEIPKSSGKIVIPSELIAKRWQPIKQRELDRKRRLVTLDGADSGGQYGTGSDSNDSGNQGNKHQDRIWTSTSRLEPNEVLLWYEINKPWRYLRHDQLDRLVTRSGCGDNRPCRHPLYSQTTSSTRTTILHLLDSSPFNHWPSTLQRTYSDSVLTGPS